MKIRALTSFSGVLSMATGEVRECSNESILNDLLQAGYVETVKETPEKPAEKPEKPTETPEEPTEKPEKPTETPEEPAEKPEKPTETLKKASTQKGKSKKE